MPKLQNIDQRPTKRIILPSSTPDDETWVEVYTEALTGDVEIMADASDKKGYASVVGVTNRIKDWNFTKEDGSKEDINPTNVRRLSQKDFLFIIENTTTFGDTKQMTKEQKKN